MSRITEFLKDGGIKCLKSKKIRNVRLNDADLTGSYGEKPQASFFDNFSILTADSNQRDVQP